jgi:hypothetical protein
MDRRKWAASITFRSSKLASADSFRMARRHECTGRRGGALCPMRARGLDGRIRADGETAGQEADALMSACALSRR